MSFCYLTDHPRHEHGSCCDGHACDHGSTSRRPFERPIRLRDGRIYGTFCCFSYVRDRSLNQRDLKINVSECARRNALTNKPAELSLAAGTVGTVLDTFSDVEPFLGVFGSRGADQCEWLGVLYASELQQLD
jgi:hypothetical protein